jgi:hypothetical protein
MQIITTMFTVFLFTVVSVHADNRIEISEDHFEDAVFREYLKNEFDTNKDGYLSEEERNNVVNIYVPGKIMQLTYNGKIASLKGLEYFPNLESISAKSNALTTIDLSQNHALKDVLVADNNLTELDVSNNPALITLSCYQNNIAVLNVTYCPYLKAAVENGTRTYVEKYNYDKIIDINGEKGTIYLDVDTETLIEIDGIPIDEAHFKDASFREYVLNLVDKDQNLHVSNNEILDTKSIDVNGWEIQTMQGLEYFTEITSLFVQNNKLEALDVSKNRKLNVISCYNNDIKTLDLSDNVALVRIDCSNNPSLVSLDCSYSTILEEIKCYECPKMASITVGNKQGFKTLVCYGDALVNLDVAGCKALNRLECQNNPIVSLDLRGCEDMINAYESGQLDEEAEEGTIRYRKGSATLAFSSSTKVITKDPTMWTISFDSEDATGNMDSSTVEEGTLYTLPACDFVHPDGKAFGGWNVTTQDGTPIQENAQIGDTITVNGNIICKAIWVTQTQLAVQLDSAAAKLDGTIGLRFYYLIPEELFDGESYALMEINGRSVKQKFSQAAYDPTSGYGFTMPVYAKESCDMVHICLYDKDGNPLKVVRSSGEDISAAGFDFSVEQYLVSLGEILNDSNDSTGVLRNLIKMTMNYCYSAKIMFNHNAEGKTLFTDLPEISEEELEQYQLVMEGDMPAEITDRLASLKLESETTLYAYLVFANDDDRNLFEYFVDDEDMAHPVALRQDAQGWYLTVPGIAAKNLDDTHVFTVRNTETKAVWKLKFSALTYARGAILIDPKEYPASYQETVTNIKNVGKALYLYNRAAKEFFKK